MNRPNVLVIMTDQQRYDSLRCYGFRGVRTPNLDRMAVPPENSVRVGVAGVTSTVRSLICG